VSGGGARTFTKRDPDAPPGFFAAEAWGLRWLAETDTVPVPAVVSVDEQHISVAYVGGGQASADGAAGLGRALAELHAVDAPHFGAPRHGFIGPLPLDNTASDHWPTFYAERRLRPFHEMATRRGALGGDGARVVGDAIALVAGLRGGWVEEPPRRIHGDLWAGNVVWDAHGRGWVIDPAAHGGHRETDLAMLHLFGLPHLDRLVAAYHQQVPLADGWRTRIGLHQLHPLLVHAALFGHSYGQQAVAVARELLDTS
jgi:fructosamine-3-kinase